MAVGQLWRGAEGVEGGQGIEEELAGTTLGSFQGFLGTISWGPCLGAVFPVCCSPRLCTLKP